MTMRVRTTVPRLTVLVSSLLACQAPPSTTSPSAESASASAAPAVRAPVVWSLAPGCTLGYEVRRSAITTMRPASAAGEPDRQGEHEGVGMREVMRVMLRPGDGTWRLVPIEHRGGFVGPDGTHAWANQAQAPAEVRLRNEGARLVEVDGPTATWAGGSIGLASLWPALPAETRVGARATWRVETYDQVSALAVEAKRGAGSPYPPTVRLPEPDPPTVHHLTVTLERVDDEVIELASSWTQRLRGVSASPKQLALAASAVAAAEKANGAASSASGLPPGAPRMGDWARALADIGADLDMSTEGRWRVLSTGRLLEARVATRIESDMRSGAGPQRTMQHHQHRIVLEARLIEACDGRVLAPVLSVRTPEEGALDAYRGFVVAMSAARPSVTDRLSRALLARWPTGAVEAVLGEYVKRFGLGALGSASMPTRVMVAGEHFAFQVNGSAQRPAEPRVLSPVAVEVELVREGGAHRVEALRARADDEELLELSVNRLHVAD